MRKIRRTEAGSRNKEIEEIRILPLRK